MLSSLLVRWLSTAFTLASSTTVTRTADTSIRPPGAVVVLMIMMMLSSFSCLPPEARKLLGPASAKHAKDWFRLPLLSPTNELHTHRQRHTHTHSCTKDTEGCTIRLTPDTASQPFWGGPPLYSLTFQLRNRTPNETTVTAVAATSYNRKQRQQRQQQQLQALATSDLSKRFQFARSLALPSHLHATLRESARWIVAPAHPGRSSLAHATRM